MALRNLLLLNKGAKLLLQNKSDLQFMRKQPKSNLTPFSGWFGDMFKMKTIKKYYEIIPIILIAGIKATVPFIHIIWMLRKNTDIRWGPGQRMKCEKHQYIIDGEQPKSQKYVEMNPANLRWPCGLLKALKENHVCDDEGDACGGKRKCNCLKFWVTKPGTEE